LSSQRTTTHRDHGLKTETRSRGNRSNLPGQLRQSKIRDLPDIAQVFFPRGNPAAKAGGS
jgi:hypothetical protein